MKCYKICTAKYTETFERYLEKQKGVLEKNLTEWQKIKGEAITTYLFDYTKKDKEPLLEQLAHVLTDVIQEKVLIYFAKKHLNKRIDLTDKEKKRMMQTLFLNHYMDHNDGASYLSYCLIYMPLVKALQKHEIVNIEGWITFKTKAYRELLKEIVEESIEEYIVQKDYLDFILLLRENQDMQMPLVEEVHLVINKVGMMRLLDSQKQDKTKEYDKAYCEQLMSQEECKQEDKIMNILVTLSPKKIIVHGKDNLLRPQFMDTIELIFLTKVEHCGGCKLCILSE
jgi:putative sporulation protein YtxC